MLLILQLACSPTPDEVPRAHFPLTEGSALRVEVAHRYDLRGDPKDQDFGWAAPHLGDVNGDGIADVVACAHGTGDVLGYAGAVGGPAEDATWAVSPPAAPNFLTVADFNGDGFADVATTTATTWPAGTTGVSVCPGTTDGPDCELGTTIEGDPGDSPSGVAATGDLNGDGYADLVAVNAEQTTVHLYVGSVAGLMGEPAGTWTGGPGGFGAGLVADCDLDGDGTDDLVIGDPLTNDPLGAFWVFRGGPAGPESTPWASMATEELPGGGWTMACAGDVNADGRDDLITEVYYDNAGYWDGEVRLWSDTGTGLGQLGEPLRGIDAHAYFGEGLAAAGDLDDDGYADVVVSDAWANGDRGRLYVFHGRASGLDPEPWLLIDGRDDDTELGLTVAGGLDVDADGRPELVAASPAPDEAHRGFLRVFALNTDPAHSGMHTGGGGSASDSGAADTGDGDANPGCGCAHIGEGGVWLGAAAGFVARGQRRRGARRRR